MSGRREKSVVIGLLAGCAGLALGAAVARRATDLLPAQTHEAVSAQSLAVKLGTRTPSDALELAVTLPVLLAGAVVGLWYALSSVLTLTCLALAATGRPWSRGEAALRRWGAPLLRRVGTGAIGVVLAAGVGTTGAGASTPDVRLPDDLGWGGGGPGMTVEDPRQPALSVENSTAAGVTGEASPRSSPPYRGTAAQYRVRPGDSLWQIASHALRHEGKAVTDAAVAAEWPRWYAANRDVVGPDPHLIRPGQVLQPPTDGDDR